MSQQSRSAALIITAGSLILLFSFGIRSSFGLFLQPMSTDLGWGREIFAFAIALQNLLWGVTQPIGGAIADRYGTARSIVVGAILYGLGVLLMAGTDSPLSLHLSAGVLVGFGLSGTSFAVVLGAIGRSVPAEKRSMALGIGTAAGSLGQFLMVPTGQLLLSEFGWSMAFVILSLFAVLMIPAAYGLKGRADNSEAGQQSLSAALSEAFSHSGYWLLNGGFFVCGFQVAFIGAHLPAYVVDLGLEPRLGAWALALVGLFNVFGAYSAGVVGGRYSKKYSLSFLYLARSVAITIFLLVPASVPSVLIFSAVIGVLWLSTVPLTSGLVAQIFGAKYLATLFGVVFLSHQLGSFLGIWLGGYLFDSTGSYDVVWWLGVALGIISALLHWPIKEQRFVAKSIGQEA